MKMVNKYYKKKKTKKHAKSTKIFVKKKKTKRGANMLEKDIKILLKKEKKKKASVLSRT